MLMLYRKNLNQVITTVNQLTEFINNLDNNFTDIYEKINTINTEIAEINANFIVFENRINTNVETRLTIFNNQILSLLNDYQTIFNNSLLNLKNELEAEINEIELGNVIAYDPTTGEYENVSTVIMNVYDILRTDAINCNEFEALDLTATQYDAKEITAYNFDVNGKTFLNVA